MVADQGEGVGVVDGRAGHRGARSTYLRSGWGRRTRFAVEPICLGLNMTHSSIRPPKVPHAYPPPPLHPHKPP